jgi:hypothetical protein
LETRQERFDFQTGKETVISNETPQHLSSGVNRKPVCAVTVNDPDNDTVTVNFYEKTN